jgi:hypothetical protein
MDVLKIVQETAYDSISTSTEYPRRTFLKMSAGAVAAAGFPAIVPASVMGQKAPSNRINIGAIGVGRISRGHDLPGIWKYDQARIVAVCDLDSKRVEEGKRWSTATMPRRPASNTTA